jgi:hypothetical protein
MSISLNQQFYRENWNVLTFYNKAAVAISYRTKTVNCLNEFSITLMCAVTLFLLPLLIMFVNIAYNPRSAVSITITLKANIIIRISLGSLLHCTCQRYLFFFLATWNELL